jgi:hypothetical protein
MEQTYYRFWCARTVACQLCAGTSSAVSLTDALCQICALRSTLPKMAREPKSRGPGALYTLTLRDVGAPQPEQAVGTISAALDYITWTIQSAGTEADLRAAKALLEQAIEAYIDEVVMRVLSPSVQLLT